MTSSISSVFSLAIIFVFSASLRGDEGVRDYATLDKSSSSNYEHIARKVAQVSKGFETLSIKYSEKLSEDREKTWKTREMFSVDLDSRSGDYRKVTTSAFDEQSKQVKIVEEICHNGVLLRITETREKRADNSAGLKKHRDIVVIENAKTNDFLFTPLFYLSPKFQNFGNLLHEDGTFNLDGKNVSTVIENGDVKLKISAVYRGMHEESLFYDAKTGLLEKKEEHLTLGKKPRILFKETIYKNYVDVRGYFLPREIIYRSFDRLGTYNATVKFTIETDSMKLNQNFPEGFFEKKVLPGSQVRDLIKNVTYIEKGENEKAILEQTIKELDQLLDAASDKRKTQ